MKRIGVVIITSVLPVLMLSGCDEIKQSTMSEEEFAEATRSLDAAADEAARIVEQDTNRETAVNRPPSDPSKSD